MLVQSSLGRHSKRFLDKVEEFAKNERQLNCAYVVLWFDGKKTKLTAQFQNTTGATNLGAISLVRASKEIL